MLIHIDVTMSYRLDLGRSVLLAIEAAQTAGQSVLSDRLDCGGAWPRHIPGEAGIGRRIHIGLDGPMMQLGYAATVDVTRPATALEPLREHPVHDLPAEALPFLRPSRYCQSDMFGVFVARRFGALSGGTKIAAIRDWVGQEMTYVPDASSSATTVLDTFATREGVCRDYAHMVCALARAANIPARYASVYAPDVVPPDFHAVAQVWLEGDWHLVDATGMSRPDDTVVITAGRDACDVAFMETVQNAQFVAQSVLVSRGNTGAAFG
ncbi:transglutaminase [Meridianimarinicoccus roseus]|uniref:Transglutaminase n=1 Tax=Meridianimarinicoccus roseus TaxID=2072018 RepID=A0A2V2L6T7_9RHOB|nr:transglutaminase family protein [Meridianimarinicoccus roseus]PWR01148.1 transglutaminase [Meridianimarinicoccus roseus]